MRSLSVRVLLSLAICLLPSAVYAHSVTVSGTTSFQALDGSADDHDGAVNGVFTVSDGDLILNGVVSCNDDSGSDSACSMRFTASGDIVVNAGGALYAENRTGSGTGGAITLTAGRDLLLRGPSTTLAGAMISTASKSSSGSTGGNITASVTRHVTLEAGSTIDAGSANAKGGAIAVVAGGTVVAGGNVFSGPSRTLSADPLHGAALTGGSSNSGGGAITISSTAFAEPAITIGSNAHIVSQGDQTATGPVTIEGCGIVIKGHVAALSRKDLAAKVVLRSGKDLVLDARDLGVAGATLGRNGRVRADAPAGTAINKGVDIFAAETLEVFGPAASASTLFPITSLAGLHDAKSFGGLIRLISTGEGINASGNVIDDGRSHSGDTGGAIELSAKSNIHLNTAVIRSFGDSSTNNPARGGGSIRIRSYSGNVVWTNGFGDVRPTGSASGLPAADQGLIDIKACGTINLAGSSFPTNGAAVGTWPVSATGLCSPAAPSLPAGTPALVTCNTPPVANDATASTREDTSVTITLSGSDVDGDPLTFSIVSGPAHGTLGSVISTGPTSATVVYTPAANYNGTDSFVFRANDGNGGTDDATATIAITAVNDVPSFLAGPTVSSLEDAPAQSYPNWVQNVSAGPADEAGQSVTFSVTNNNNALFSVQPALSANGTLTWTSAPNAYGTATISVTAHDNGGTANGGADTSAAQSVTITVTPVNDAPSFTAGGNVTVSEDAAAYAAAWATAINAGPNEASQNVSFTATNTNNALFSVQPAIAPNGTLTFTLAPNANGSSSVTVTLKDDGGVANGGIDSSAASSFTITVSAVNDDPSFTTGGNVTVLEDSGAYSAAWATAIAAGPSDESSQTVSFTATNDNNALFSAQPAIAANGTLTFIPAANAFGSANVTVTLADNAGGSSAAQTFAITLTAVNDAPSFTAGANVTVAEDAAAYAAAWATALSAGPNETQNLTFAVSNSNAALFSVAPSISSNGTLTFTVAPDASGSATITVTLSDDGGTANGGADASASQTSTITVTAVNDTPSFTAGGNVTVLEDSAAYSAAWATAISAGPSDEAGQSLTFNVTNSNNALFAVQPSISSNGTLTFTPAANAFGSATITVTLSDDGGAMSAAQTFTVTIDGINDAPSFTAGGSVSVNEDSAAYSSAWATAIAAGAGESGQTLTFNVSNDNNALFASQPAISASGVLTFTLGANAFGSASVTVTLSDDGGTANGGVDTSASQTFTITVNAVNDAPSFTGSGNVTVDEDSGAYANAWAGAISAGPANENTQAVAFTVTNSNNALFGMQPSIDANGVLTFTPAPNTFGTATVTVTLSDNGGTANGGADTSASQTFTITVANVNDAPSFTPGPNVTVDEDSGAYAAAWATNISAGQGEVQPLTFTVTNSNNALFAVQPAIAPNGLLTFTLTPNTHGVANVTVTLSDGIDTTAAVTFTITVNNVNDLPIVNNESYETIGNTMLEVSGSQSQTGAVVFVAGSLLANDSDPDNAPAPLTAALATATPGATVVIQPNGTFTYLPPAGHNAATDSFQYTVSDGASTALGTVTITLKGRVWYVKNNVTSGNGRSHDAFSTLAAAEAASVAGDTIYVYSGDGTTTGQNAGITLKNHQRLIGAGVALDVPVSVNGGANPTVLTAAGAQPQIGNGAGNGVTITGVSADVSGLSIAGSANGILVNGVSASARITSNTIRAAGLSGISAAVTGAATLAILNNDVTATGTAISVIGGSAASTLVATGNSVKSLTSTGISLQGALLTVTQLANNSVHGDTALHGISAASVTFDATPGGAFDAVSGGTTAVGSTGNPVGGAGIALGNVKGHLSFTSLTALANGGAALQVSGGGANQLTVGSTAGSLSANGGPAIDANGVNLNLTLASITSTNSSSKGLLFANVAGTSTIAGGSISGAATGGVDVAGGTLTLTYGGSITSTTQRSVSVTGHATGTLTFSGAITGTANGGVNLANNSGTTVFGGTLNLSTGSNVAFQANNGGNVAVTGPASTLTTTTASALRLVNTTIAPAGVTFRGISSNGAASGIVLNATGNLGGLTVTGNGAAGSGGTINGSTASGVSLLNTANVSLSWMNINGSGDDGISATGVNGFALHNCSLANNGNSGTDEGVELDNVTGTVTLNATTFSNSAHNHVHLDNAAGAATVNVTGSSFQNLTGPLAASALLLELRNTASLTSAQINSNTFGNVFANAILVTAAQTASAGSVEVGSNSFTSQNIAVQIVTTNASSATFNVHDNIVNGSQSSALVFGSSAVATGGQLRGRIVNNTIGSASVPDSGSAFGNGIRIVSQGMSANGFLIQGNTIRQTPYGRGIELMALGSATIGQVVPVTDATIVGNDVNPQDVIGFPLAAIYVTSDNQGSAGSLRADIRNNIVPAASDTWDGPSFDGTGTYLRLDEINGGSTQLVDTAPASANATAQLTSTNTGSASAAAGVALIPGPISVP